MSWPSDAERILERGRFGTIEYAVRANGEMEAKDWFESQDRSVRISFGVLFKRVLSDGRIPNKTQCRQLKDQVWEFKRGPNRLLFYQLGNRRLLTHHYRKGGQKCPRKQIDRAQAIADEHIQREARSK